MNIRAYQPSDINELTEIHSKYFDKEFALPDFLLNYLCAITIEDDRGIITIGGVRNIAEILTVTNKDRSVRVRYEALIKMLQVLTYVAQVNNHTQLHAFIQDPIWEKHLINHGFNPTKGKA